MTEMRRLYCCCSVGSVFALLPYSLHCQVAQLSAGESAMSHVSTRVEVQRMKDSLAAVLAFSALDDIYSRTSFTVFTHHQMLMLLLFKIVRVIEVKEGIM